MARRYEFYFLVARTIISHSFAALTREILFLPREHKIHIFEPTYNVLFIIWRNQFNKSKRRESWRHWTIRHSQRWHTENTPLGSRMNWRMESTSGLVPSKTLSSIIEVNICNRMLVHRKQTPCDWFEYISPGLINKVDSIIHLRSVVQVHSYGSCPQSTLLPIRNNVRRIKLTFSVATGQQMQSDTSQSLGDHVREHIK